MKEKQSYFHLHLSLPKPGREVSVRLAANASLRIGRELGSDILVNSPEISPRHAEILSVPEGLIIRKPGETRGQKLFPGQSINLGPLTLALRTGKIPPPPKTAGKTPGSSRASRIRVILFVLIGLGLAFLFLVPAPEPPAPPSLREDASGPVEPSGSLPPPGGEIASLSPGERIEQARASFALGEQRLRDRKISIENLGLAQAEFLKTAALLEGIQPAPDLWTILNARLREAEVILEEEFRRRKFSAEQAARFQDLDRAELELKNIQKLLHNPNDPRSRYAQERLKEIGRAK